MAVRPARHDDVAALAGVLARAFDDDPVTAWVYANARTRSRWSTLFFAWQLERLLPQDVTWTTDGREGAAIWALPGRWREGPMDMVRVRRAPGGGTAPPRRGVRRGLGQVEPRHPDNRHFYLAVLGVDPDRQ